MKLEIYTDGSSRGNPGPGGYGAVILTEDRVREIAGREAHTTNNRMELMAAISALKSVEPGASRIEIYTDSEYVMKGITTWVHSWITKGWRTAAKKPVLNQDLWQELLALTQGKDIAWKYVQGHAGHNLNERCDELATTLADNLKIDLYDGPRSGYTYL